MDEREGDDQPRRRADIRAGSVSGPWRGASAPGDPAATGSGRQAPATHILRAMEQMREREPAPATNGPTEPGGRRPIPNHLRPVRGAPRPPAAGPGSLPRDARAAPVPILGAPPSRRRAGGVRPAVGLGAVLALAIIAAAVVLRPEGQAGLGQAGVGQAGLEQAGLELAGTSGAALTAATPEPQLAERAPVVPAEAAAAAVPAAMATAAADPATSVPGGLRVRVGPNLAPERREAIVAALSAAGYNPATVEVLPFRIATSRVGFYHAADAEAAAALADFVTGVIMDPAIDVKTRDYGKLLEDAPPGRLDVWIEG